MDEIVLPVYVTFGKQHCAGCRAAAYRPAWGARVDVCNTCMAGLEKLLEEDPERIIAYDASKGSFLYTRGVRAGWDDQGTPGNNNARYTFGQLPTVEQMLEHPYPFNNRQLVALVKLRSKIQDARIDAHRTVHPDGF